MDSINFPGQVHRWQLSQLLQKGTERSKQTLLDDLALALRFVIVTARNRIVSHFFSVTHAIRAFYSGLFILLDVLIGLPSLQAHNLDAKIREERCRYLVAELVCPVSNHFTPWATVHQLPNKFPPGGRGLYSSLISIKG